MNLSDVVRTLDDAGLFELGKVIAELPGHKKAQIFMPVTQHEQNGWGRYHMQMALLQMLQEGNSGVTASECIERQRQMT